MKTIDLIAFSVPTFALTGMAVVDGKPAAKVLSHDGKEIKLDVSGSQVVVALVSKERYAEGTTLLFGDDGAVVGYEDNGKDVIVKPQKTTTADSSSATRRSGTTDYRKDDIRQ